jgi:integrase
MAKKYQKRTIGNNGPLKDAEIRSFLKVGDPIRISDGRGLYFVINDNASSFWAIRYTRADKKRPYHFFALASELSLKDARMEAAVLIKKIKTEGYDPAAEKSRISQQSIKVVNDLWLDFIERKSKKIQSADILASLYRREIKPVIGHVKLDKVEPLDIRFIIERIMQGYDAHKPRPSVSNKALNLSTQLFSHGVKLNLIKFNPSSSFTAQDAGGSETPKEFALKLNEVKQLFKALRPHIGTIAEEDYWGLALLSCTGVRKMELFAAPWSEFDFDKQVWHLPKQRNKSKRAISIPLAPESIAWLQRLKFLSGNSNYVFPGRRGKDKENRHVSDSTLNNACLKLKNKGVIPWSEFDPHSLRHTCRSLLSEQKEISDVAERYINHKLKGLNGVYDNHDYFEERKAAAIKLTSRISPFVNVSFQTK